MPQLEQAGANRRVWARPTVAWAQWAFSCALPNIGVCVGKPFAEFPMRITSLFVPVALGLALGCYLPTSSDAQQAMRPPAVNTWAQAGTTSPTPGTFTVALAADHGARYGCGVVNTGSATLLVALLKPGVAAAASMAVPVAAGQTFRCEDGEQDEVDVASSTASAPYVSMVR